MAHPKAPYKEGVYVAHFNPKVTVTLDLDTATEALRAIREQVAEAFRADTPMACVAALRAVDELATAALAKCDTGPGAPEWEYPPLPAGWVREAAERSWKDKMIARMQSLADEKCNADDKFLRKCMDAARRHEELSRAVANPQNLDEYLNTRTLSVDVAAQMYGVPRQDLTTEPDADTPVIVEKTSQ